jgi:hypothetical protein
VTYQIARRCWRWILPVPVLLMLLACESAPPQVVYVDRPVEVPVPVVQKVEERLTQDCEPRTDVPYSGALPVGAALERLAAVEDALAICRNQVAEIRGAK